MISQRFGLAAAAAVLILAPVSASAQGAAADPSPRPASSEPAGVGQSDDEARAGTGSPAAPEADQPTGTCCTIPARTSLELEIVDRVSSKANRAGDRFAIRLAEPLLVDGQILIPAGTAGVGEVIHSA